MALAVQVTALCVGLKHKPAVFTDQCSHKHAYCNRAFLAECPPLCNMPRPVCSYRLQYQIHVYISNTVHVYTVFIK